MRRMWDERHYSYPGRSARLSPFETKGFAPHGEQKSAEAILRMANPSEGPNMKTKGEALTFAVTAAQKIYGNQPGASGGEAPVNLRRCVK